MVYGPLLVNPDLDTQAFKNSQEIPCPTPIHYGQCQTHKGKVSGPGLAGSFKSTYKEHDYIKQLLA